MTTELTQQAFDALYEELKQYRENFLEQAEKPLLLDLLLFYDSMNWFRQSMDKQDMSEEVLVDSFQYLMDEFLEILYRRDVAPMEASEFFDRTRHRAVRAQKTTTAEDHERILKVLKRGFQRGNGVLRAEEVEIYRADTDDGNP